VHVRVRKWPRRVVGGGNDDDDGKKFGVVLIYTYRQLP
jgi:hypothetical protein